MAIKLNQDTVKTLAQEGQPKGAGMQSPDSILAMIDSMADGNVKSQAAGGKAGGGGDMFSNLMSHILGTGKTPLGTVPQNGTAPLQWKQGEDATGTTPVKTVSIGDDGSPASGPAPDAGKGDGGIGKTLGKIVNVLGSIFGG